MSPVNVPAIGAYIREQREQARISLRQLAQATGVSNPYLSQIERGLRKPSADILQQLAKGLRISAEALYVQAGFLEDRPEGYGVQEAVLADPALTERQKQMLLEIYDSFKNETNLDAEQADSPSAEPGDGTLDPAALTWPELAEGHAASSPDQPDREQPDSEQAALEATALQEGALQEGALAEAALVQVAVEEAALEAAALEQVAREEAALEQAALKQVAREEAALEQAVAEQAIAGQAEADAGQAERAATGRTQEPAVRRARPRRATSKGAAPDAAEPGRPATPKSTASSGNGNRARRARPSTARNR